jgi:hypothetical protein
MKNVMVDLETLGTDSYSVITSIGAVEFDHITGNLGVDAGLKMDVSTILWWMKQSDEARADFQQLNRTLTIVLDNFTFWYPKGAALWGNGAGFDNVVLSNAYLATGLVKPWGFRADRCYRTLRELLPTVVVQKSGVAHNALADAKNQALHTIELLRSIQHV